MSKNDLEELINTEKNQVTFHIFRDDEILLSVTQNRTSISNEEEGQIDGTPLITHAEVTVI